MLTIVFPVPSMVVFVSRPSLNICRMNVQMNELQVPLACVGRKGVSAQLIPEKVLIFSYFRVVETREAWAEGRALS